MKDKVEVKRIDNIDLFKELRSEWEQLLDTSENKNIFLTWEWLYTWWTVFADDNEMWLLTIRENGALIGIAPLMLSTQKKLFLELRVLRSIGTPQCDIGGFISIKGEQVSNIVTEYLKEYKNKWDILEIKSLPDSVPESEVLPTIFQKEKYRVIKNYDEHFYLPLNEDWETYYKGLSRNLRRNMKKQSTRAKKIGSLRYELYKGATLQWEHFLKIFELNEKGSFPELYRPEKSKKFFRQLYDLMGENGQLQIEMLYIGEEAVAFQCGYNFNQKYLDWRGSYDLEYRAFGPGKLLIMFAIEQRYKDAIKEIDFLRGAHSYKSDWKPLKRNFVDLRIFNTKKTAAFIAYHWLENIKPRVKSFQERNAR